MIRRVPEDARMEIKFVAMEHELQRLRRWLQVHPAGFRSPYPARRVNNVYFDTYNYFAFSENLSGASARTKLRYRWYGAHDYPDAGTLEVKCKRNYYGWKLLYPSDRAPWEEGDSWRDVRSRLIRLLQPEAALWLRANPQPVILNRYEREYFVSQDGRVRATLDTHQSVYDQRYKPWPNVSRSANLPRTLVMEFKFDRNDRALASHLLQGLPLRVSRNSKYITGVRSVQGL